MLRILKNDYGAMIGLLLPVVFWGIAIAAHFFDFLPARRGGSIEVDSSSRALGLIGAAAATLVFVPLSVWRMRHVNHVLSTGAELDATITSVAFEKDRGRVEYKYEWEGKVIQSGNGIMKTRQTKSLQEGDVMKVIVNPSNPAEAFLASVYL